MSSLTASRRERRFLNLAHASILNDRVYNLALGSVVLYGLIVNTIICFTLDDAMSRVNPIVLLIGYFVCCIIGSIMSAKSNNPFISFIGYNFVVIPIGLVLSITISAYVNEGAGYLVKQAIVYTAIVTAVMIGLSIAFPIFFSKLGKILLGALFGLIITELICLIIFGYSPNIFSLIGAAIFSLYIGYDFWKAQQYPKTLDNAVDSALDIYLDIINLFIRILEILGNSSSNDD